jgi:hypothetical protein
MNKWAIGILVLVVLGAIGYFVWKNKQKEE